MYMTSDEDVGAYILLNHQISEIKILLALEVWRDALLAYYNMITSYSDVIQCIA